MEFRLDLAARAVKEKKSRPFLLIAVALGIYLLFVVLVFCFPILSYLTFLAMAPFLSVALFYTIIGLVLLLLLVRIFRPAGASPYRSLWINEGGIHSDNGQLRLRWHDIGRLQLRHDVLSLGLRNDADLQLDVRTPGFPVAELEAFAFACIQLARQHG